MIINIVPSVHINSSGALDHNKMSLRLDRTILVWLRLKSVERPFLGSAAPCHWCYVKKKKGRDEKISVRLKKKMPRKNTRLLEKAINNSQKELYPVNRAKTCECSFLTFPVCLRPARARPRHPVFETRILQVHVRRAEYNLVPRWCGVS